MIKRGLSRSGIFFLYLISWLPFWLLYILADILFVALYYLTRYRRKVVQENLRNSFPDKTKAELGRIEKQYYQYLADLIVETIKSITISAKEITKRITPTNPELINHYLDSGRNVVAVAGHYCNWEMGGLSLTAQFEKTFLMVYKPLSNKILDDFFKKTRSRFGGILVPMKQILRKLVEYKDQPIFTILVADQTPVREEANYFTTFLNQPTAVFLGIEKMARLNDAVVLFFDIIRVKRGYYTYTIVPLTENAKQTAPNEITEMHVRYLESMINKAPQHWLWSHRRWKFKPQNTH